MMDYLFDMNICDKKSFNCFIENLKEAHQKAPNVYFQNEEILIKCIIKIFMMLFQMKTNF